MGMWVFCDQMFLIAGNIWISIIFKPKIWYCIKLYIFSYFSKQFFFRFVTQNLFTIIWNKLINFIIWNKTIFFNVFQSVFKEIYLLFELICLLFFKVPHFHNIIVQLICRIGMITREWPNSEVIVRTFNCLRNRT